ncbi:polyphosphate polymerase domain-containing protein [Tenuifilum thalassicum]|uniref:Polyphosphate polymerase domain-containing protein n=1 Tax=Tenuifilum thalassicum TaxID=2590900 RepID=A0A7D4AWW9_9BACT|nr:polyphosphate polymerase domain-containing protein [Tenuifilum thalassicum]QKG79734.1 polyphosphate polymerase domain-containing protein [Tenuifilum thalassicum]
MINSLSDITLAESGLKSINICTTGQVQFLKRVDSKFIISAKWAQDKLIEHIKNNYYIVENNSILFPLYTSIYYDTEKLDMYLQHHNNRPKRYKVRTREYHASGDFFLEVKFRNHAGETLKKRIQPNAEDITENILSNFIDNNTPYRFKTLQKVLETRFNRITLVSMLFNERVTLDFNISLKDIQNQKSILLNDICIVESKRDKYNKTSVIMDFLKQAGYRKRGFSKYAIGCALLNQHVKTNNFKPTINHLNKIRNENNVVLT